MREPTTFFSLRLLNRQGVTGTAKDRQAGIFWKAGISVREFTAIECRSAGRLNPLRVLAVETQANAAGFIVCCFCHIRRIVYPVAVGAGSGGVGRKKLASRRSGILIGFISIQTLKRSGS
jgi:hypothetical protein